jgi:hypothetical protein
VQCGDVNGLIRFVMRCRHVYRACSVLESEVWSLNQDAGAETYVRACGIQPVSQLPLPVPDPIGAVRGADFVDAAAPIWLHAGTLLVSRSVRSKVTPVSASPCRSCNATTLGLWMLYFAQAATCLLY